MHCERERRRIFLAAAGVIGAGAMLDAGTSASAAPGMATGQKANKQVDLVTVLRRQHQAGRHVTDAIRGLATPAAVRTPEGSLKLVAALLSFRRMYRPHAAREDTVLFPELRSLVGAREYDALGEAFEDKEHAVFGPKGFESVVAEVAQLERALGIHDLAKFTPP